jgi:hypothetical protein
MVVDETEKRWYARRDGVIRGPFTADIITRHILLGRIRMHDEVSEDRESWQTAKLLTSLLPDEVRHMSGWEDYQRFIVARMRVDERKLERRDPVTTLEDVPGTGRRSGMERRTEDSALYMARHAFEAEVSPGLPGKRPPRLGTLVLTLVLAMVVFVWLVPAGR